VGCFLDLDAMQIHWSLNGTEFPVAFQLSSSLKNRAFYPTVTLKVPFFLFLFLSFLSLFYLLIFIYLLTYLFSRHTFCSVPNKSQLLHWKWTL
jgi:hypothetical protein